MEPIGAFPEGEWDFSRMFSREELDFTSGFPGRCSFTVELNEGLHFATPSAFCTNPDGDVSMAGFNESSFYSSSNLNPNLHYRTPQENSSASTCSSSVFAYSSSHENCSFSNTNYVPETNDTSMAMDICIMHEKITGSFAPLFPEIAMTGMNEGMSSETMGNLDDSQLAANAVVTKAAKEMELKREFDSREWRVNPSNNMKKKPRITRNVQSNKGNAKPKRNKKLAASSNDEEQNNPGPDGQRSSSCNSEKDNASQDSRGAATSEPKGPEALNPNGKSRTGRGSATDPQSLYGRNRRERINERLRILQNLVPNGTKVDISTMLEEAVHYVKFLQLQIKLLSSDDLWMYAPIAFNGIDIGLNEKVSTLI